MIHQREQIEQMQEQIAQMREQISAYQAVLADAHSAATAWRKWLGRVTFLPHRTRFALGTAASASTSRPRSVAPGPGLLAEPPPGIALDLAAC